MTNQISKPVKNIMYSYESRWSSIYDAKNRARGLNGAKHAYYQKVQVKGNAFFDVRSEN